MLILYIHALVLEKSAVVCKNWKLSYL